MYPTHKGVILYFHLPLDSHLISSVFYQSYAVLELHCTSWNAKYGLWLMVNLLGYVSSSPSVKGCLLTLELEMAFLYSFREGFIPLWTTLTLYDLSLPCNKLIIFIWKQLAMENRGDANQSPVIWIYQKFRGAFLSMLFLMILCWRVLPVLLDGMQWKISALLGADCEMFLC